MLKIKNNQIVFFTSVLFIFFLGVFLRFVKLETINHGFYVDEATIGYNAYSILKTGKDEYGKLFPFLFRSFGDYKMPVYIYFSVIPIAILGLNPFSVRFISALSGSLTIICIFLLMREMFGMKRKWLPVIGALVFALSPWSVFFSRGAFESNLALFFLTFGIYLFIKGFKNNSFLLVVSLIILAFSTYTYHAERLIIFLFFLLFFVLFKRETVSRWNRIRLPMIIGFFVFFLLEIPQLIGCLYPAGQVRFKTLSLLQQDFLLKNVWEVFSQYAAYFSPRNLFFNPDSDLQRSLPELSVFYPWMVIPYFFGLWHLIRYHNDFGEKLTIVLLLISPVAASLTGDPFSSLRSQPLLLPMTMVISLGLYYLISLVKNKILKIMGILLIVFFSLVSFYRSNFILLPRERFSVWKYGFSELTENLTRYKNEKILIDDPEGTSYVELLFFLKYNPEDYQRTISPRILAEYYKNVDWNKKSSFANIEVWRVEWKKDVYKNQIIVGGPLSISEEQAKEHFLKTIFIVGDPEGKPIFNGFITNPDLKIKDDLRKLKLKKQKEKSI